ncbi:MAG: RluA family pseudouridine synthase [Planctomycetota bacterium]|nr:RluA family pseudouridine synthase [Planctomycetota bacterium]
MPRLTRQYLDLSKPLPAFTFTVDIKEAGARLDLLLRGHYPWHSRTFYRAKVERGEVRVNGRTAKPSAKVREGDVVEIELPRDPAVPDREDGGDLVVLYEDEQLVAIDKPSGMAVHPVGRTRHGTLINKLHARYRRDDPERDVVPRLAHRLDRDTSGIVLAVKDRETDAAVMDMFMERRVAKTYFALVTGLPGADEGYIDAPLGPDPDGDTGMHQAVRADGLPARTRWFVRRRFARHAWLELDLLTGRTHQLRVHLAHIGHPIVCDHLYGDVRPVLRSAGRVGIEPALDEAVLTRLGLHAHHLRLEHPTTGEPLAITSPIPTDLELALEALA